VVAAIVLGRPVGTANHSKHTKPERIEEQDHFTHRAKALLGAGLFFSRISRVSLFELPNSELPIKEPTLWFSSRPN
jgi:hypothetical protein